MGIPSSISKALPPLLFMFFSSRLYRVWIWICSPLIVVLPISGFAQIVEDANPNTSTQTRVQTNIAGDRHTIDQGRFSSDGTNVFHHFSQFDLPTDNTAIFDLQDTPAIVNILNRVLGNNPSEINGALEILGGNNPNLFLINPAGVIFGENASLNIPGDFTVTTADNIQFGDETWLGDSDAANYANFNGVPTGFEFLQTAGIILSGADLAVADGQSINFVANGIVNKGNLTATDGSITLTALPKTGMVKLSQAGNLLDLEFIPNSNSEVITPLDFARLLTGNDLDLDPVEFALDITVENDLLQLPSGISLPQTSGILFSESALNTNTGNVAIAGLQVGTNASISGQSLNLNAAQTFILLPDGSLDFANGDVAIAASSVGIYDSINANSLTLDAPDGLEVTTPFNVADWSITTNEVEIGTPQSTTTIDVANPFSTDLTTSYLDTVWLNQSLISGDGSIISENGNITLNANLQIDNISDSQLSFNSAQKLTLDGAINPSSNQLGKLSLVLNSQDDLTVNQNIQTDGGDITLESGSHTFINADIDVGSGELFFTSDIQIGDITLGSSETKKVEFQGQVNGDSDLTITASEITFLDAIGENTPLNNISLNTDDINIGDRLFNNGEFRLSALSNSTGLTLGSDVEDSRLNLSDLEISRLAGDLSELTFIAPEIEIFSDLSFSDELTLEATSGNIQANNFELQAPKASLTAGENVALGSVQATDLNLTANGNITSDNPLAIAGLLTINTDASVTLDNNNNDFNQIDLVRANNGLIRDINNVEFVSSDIAGDLQVFAASIQAANVLDSSGSLEFTATDFITTKDLNVGQDINLSGSSIQTGDLITSNGSVDINSIQDINTANISAVNTIDLSSQNGTITSGNITTRDDISIFAANDLSVENISSGRNTTLKSDFGSIEMKNLTAVDNINILAADNITTRDITAGQVQINSELGLIQTDNIVARNSSLTLTSEQGLNTDDLTAATNIQLSSLKGAIATKNILANNSINISALENLDIGNTSGTQVRLDSTSGSIQTGNITATNSSATITADQNLTTKNLDATTDINLTSRKGAIATNNLTSTNGTIKLIADSNVDVGQITAKAEVTATAERGNLKTTDISTQGKAIALTAGDEIQSGNLTSKSTTENGGDVTVKAIQAIATGNIDSSSVAGDAGDVFIDPIGDIQIGYVNAESLLGRAGDVEMIAGRHIRLTETFEAASGDQASISTIGGTENGEINLSHGGGDNQKFQVGDSSVNGSAGALVQGDITIPEGSSFEADVDTVNIKAFRAEDFPQTLPSPRALQVEAFSVDFFKDITVEDLAISGEDLANVERQFANTYIEKFNLQEQSSRPSAQVEKTLKKIKAQTNTEPAVVYAFFRPDTSTDVQAESQGEVEWRFQDKPLGQDSDVLELVMVTADGNRVRRRIRGATRQEVVFQANRFFSHVTNLRLRNAYLYSARELHRILVEPLEAEMKAAGVDNLTYIMDSGLRVLPLAALYDGQQFLVEKYSLGTMPSFELTNTNYVNLNDSSVLAMGSSEFEDTLDLPAVPLELNRVRAQVGDGEIFLNEQFTVENLVAARRDTPHNIVHLATHGEFLPGNLDNSYIQFWDERLTLQDLSKLELSNPVVNLLVLSACRTALGNQDAEMGFAGLAIASGAKSVLGSLWYVSDEGTLGLMSEFYRALRTTPIKAEALRQAQLAMLRGDVTFKKSTFNVARGEVEPLPHIPPELAVVTTQDFSHPYYWSAFNMVGNPW